MFASNDDDDGDFLAGGKSSKLASLFGIDQSMAPSGNEKLTYTAPKEPKKKKPAEETAKQPASTPVVLQAAAVHAYKFVDGAYASQGKLGCALLANHNACDYKLLLYVTKQQQVTSAVITPAWTFTNAPNNYAIFYDDPRQSWSIMFDTDKVASDFSKNIALMRALSAGGSLDTVIHQELSLGSGGGLENADSAEVRYTGWLLKDHTFGPVFDSNVNAEKLFRFKMGKGKIIKGWEEGMLGMQRGGRRLLIVPPQLAYGAKGAGNKVPPNATLIFDVELIRVKFARERESPDSNSSVAATPSPSVSTTSLASTAPVAVPTEAGVSDASDADDTSVRGRTRTLSEQMEQPKSTKSSDKSKLISRMAKMGQPMLPNMGGAVAAEPESDEEDQGTQQTHVTSTHKREIPASPPKPSLPPKPGADHASVHPGMASAVPQPGTVPPQQPSVVQAQQQPGLPAQPTTHPGMPVQQAGFPLHPGMPMQHPGMMHHDGFGMVHGTSAYVGAPQPPQVIPPHGMPPTSQEFVTSTAPHPAVFQGVQMPSQMALYQPHQQPFQQYQQPGQYPASSYAPGAPSVTPPPVTHAVAPSSELPVLFSETRQQNTEIRLAIGSLSDKLDRISEKIPQNTGAMNTAPNMETGILVHNIQRIVQENERMKQEVFEKSARIEAQNEKIAELLQRNQKYVEQSNQLLEERNDSFKTTSSQSQARLRHLEQEKVQLATDLSTATAQLTTVQLEVASLRKSESEYRLKLDDALTNTQSQNKELSHLRVQNSEYEQQVERLTTAKKKKVPTATLR